MTLQELHTRIVEMLPDLPRQVGQAGRHVVDHPDAVLIHSMRDMAARAGVSPATLLRLTQALGFESWADFRAVHADDLRRAPDAYADRASRALDRSGLPALLEEGFAAHRANLDHAVAVNPPEVFTRAAGILAEADRVFISAFMSCRSPGLTFAYLCRMLRDNVAFLGGESASLAADLALLRPNDAVLSINFQPYGHEIDKVARAVADSGARLICLSDSRATQATRVATETLIFPVEGPSFFPSLTVAHALVESLIVSLLARLGEDATKRIRKIENALYESGTYSSVNNQRKED
jgi:DNA-binding MurR/RpiR family transcriptional regulator